MKSIVREATLDDAEQVATFNKRWAGEYPDIDAPYQPQDIPDAEVWRDIIKRHLERENSNYFVAEADGQIIGILPVHGGLYEADHHACSLGLYIDKAWRGRGVGRAMMTHAMNWIIAGDVLKRIMLLVYETNIPAIRLYESFGFEVEGRRRKAYFQRERYIDMLLMARLLD